MKYTIILALALALSGCAYAPIHANKVSDRIDPISIHDHVQFRADVQTCTTLANDRANDMMKEALLAGLAGALAGAALGGAMGNVAGVDASRMAGVGAVAGATSAGAASTYRGMTKAQTIVYNCLINRGYRLLY